ncbi:uncharacterized protein LOC117921910 [Vitis riparia]|uniref:uncharacterized protein LOC117921910 n=1 Tax=Vitis riparia TaxID=96939 RepID=UPI00155A7597|nr:uncharacterized protein LOC117921910 [Vitis riparia]
MNGSGDMEAASASGGGMVGGDEDEVVYLDPFNIATTKNASVETLKRWRVEGGSTSWHLVLRWNYVNLNAWLTMIVLCVLSGERGGALGTQHSCCGCFVLEGLGGGWVQGADYLQEKYNTLKLIFDPLGNLYSQCRCMLLEQEYCSS